MDAFDASKHDRLQQSLSSAWASFLSAQHCSHEIGALKKALDEHIRQANLSISSIQRDAADRHNSVTAAVAESKAKIEEHSAELEEIDNLRRRLLAFQQEASQDRENVSRRFTEISEKIAAQQGSLEVMRSAVFQDTKTVQEQYRLALEKIESLQGELRELRAEKMASELRLEALELRMAGMSQARQELSEEMVAFLDQVLSRRDGLMRLLDNQDRIVSAQIHTPPAPHENEFETQPPPKVGLRNRTGREASKAVKKKTAGLSQTHTTRTAPFHGQDIETLYFAFRERYKTSPPKSDVDFIWEFISSIESPELSKHVQESLAGLLPEYVTRSRDTRRKDPQRHINISKGLTWRKFREALIKIPLPP